MVVTALKPELTRPVRTLDSLAAMSAADLEALYRDAPLPATLTALDGAPRGRMLAVRRLERGLVGRAIRRFAASGSFVWDGKSFVSAGPRVGTGINRVQVPLVLGRQKLFPFTTRIGASALDGKDAIVLDYDLPDNPPYIRKIHDEVREVSPGVFLGPAMWKATLGPVLLLWFSLDTGKRA